MNHLQKIHTVFLVIFIASCSNLVEKHPDNKPVRLINEYELDILNTGKTPDCHYLGEVVDSEVHWYTYLSATKS